MSEGRNGGKRERRPGSSRTGKRSYPPQSTGGELGFFSSHRESRETVTVRLRDGREIHGVVEYYDRDMVKINREVGPHLFVRKRDIRYVREDGGSSD